MDNPVAGERPFNTFGSFSSLKPGQIHNPYLSSLPDTISSEFIVPEGSARSRGRFELAFSQIGASVMVGSGLGSAVGTYKGIIEVSKLEAFLSVKRTQLLNYITRNGASMANTFGVITLAYSAIGVGLSFVQDENDDANTLISAVATGGLYGALTKPKVQSTSSLLQNRLIQSQLRRSAVGSLIGLLAAFGYILSVNGDKYLKN